MRPSDVDRAQKIEQKLNDFSRSERSLPGIQDPQYLSVLLEQIIESIRRIEFVELILGASFDDSRANPQQLSFDPLRAAVFWSRRGNHDEACWLVFLATHFGKHPKDGWGLVRAVYGGFGSKTWSWKSTTNDLEGFRKCLVQAGGKLPRITQRFGNHRKYESLFSEGEAGTFSVIKSYIEWIAPPQTHDQMVRSIHKRAGQDPKVVFREMYRGMSVVKRFGRLGKFDYLTMLSKLGLAPIEADCVYISEATGPRRGANLLFGGRADCHLSADDLEKAIAEMSKFTGLSMQVIEDALCNWQKSPDKFVPFR
jgi:hypothetical protein